MDDDERRFAQRYRALIGAYSLSRDQAQLVWRRISNGLALSRWPPDTEQGQRPLRDALFAFEQPKPKNRPSAAAKKKDREHEAHN